MENSVDTVENLDLKGLFGGKKIFACGKLFKKSLSSTLLKIYHFPHNAQSDGVRSFATNFSQLHNANICKKAIYKTGAIVYNIV